MTSGKRERQERANEDRRKWISGKYQTTIKASNENVRTSNLELLT